MRNTYIYTETKKLIKKYGTRDPFEIMDQMNIVVGETSRYKTIERILLFYELQDDLCSSDQQFPSEEER